jgi:hypothetical protein
LRGAAGGSTSGRDGTSGTSKSERSCGSTFQSYGGGFRTKAPCEAAQAIHGRAHAQPRRGAVERDQRVAGLEEGDVAQQRAIEPAGLFRLGDDRAELAPGVEEERAQRIARHAFVAGEDGAEPVAAVEQQGKELSAQDRVGAVERELLDGVDEERIPGLERLVQRFELGVAERCRRDCRRGGGEPGIGEREAQGNDHVGRRDARLLDLRLRDHLLQRLPIRRGRGGAHDAEQRLAGGGEVVAEALEARMHVALAHFPDEAGRGRAALVGHARFGDVQAQATRRVDDRHEREVERAAPARGVLALPEKVQAERPGARCAHAQLSVRRRYGRRAEGEIPAAPFAVHGSAGGAGKLRRQRLADRLQRQAERNLERRRRGGRGPQRETEDR